ncbi:MAG TPA: cache domain-containing protein, partial [Candidatus Dormibacteraeota bacterium]|nr:cache domain-containing protein [Candidatus Dormibacteraeota bacterium]
MAASHPGRLRALLALRGRLSVRLVAGLLVVSLPIIAALAILLTRSASSSLQDDSGLYGSITAADTALRVGDWAHDRQVDVQALGVAAGGHWTDASALQANLATLAPLYDDFDNLIVLDTAGRVRASDPATPTIAVTGHESWFPAALSAPVLTDITTGPDGRLVWVVAGPIRDRSGAVVGVVAGDLHESALQTLMAHRQAGSGDVRIFNRNHLLVFDSAYTGAQDDASLLGAAGYFRSRLDDPVLDRAAAGQTGSGRIADLLGQDVIAGYAPVGVLDWAVVVSRSAATVLAPVDGQSHLALLLTAIA